ncbi:MAG: hypothetical protein MAG431_00196 [Chloroflexi bacterium]|nr:hypothetical protein [Chloroflexota bacterium]
MQDVTTTLNEIAEMYLFKPALLTHVGPWFNHRVDMTALSVKFPSLLFTLDVIENNRKARQRDYFFNSHRYGRMFLVDNGDTFDPKALKKVEPPYATGVSSLSEFGQDQHAEFNAMLVEWVRSDIAPRKIGVSEARTI